MLIFPDCRNSQNLKWTKYGKDVLPMWIADLDVMPPEYVTEAIKKSLVDKNLATPIASKNLFENIVNYLKLNYNWNTEESWIVPISGISSGIYISSYLANPQQIAITLSPTHPPFIKASLQTKRTCKTIPMCLERNSRWSIDFDLLKKSIMPSTKIFFLSNPNNPTGTSFNKVELEMLAKIAKENDLLVVSDETLSDTILKENYSHTPIASLDDDISKRTITFISPSKAYGISGLNTAFAIIKNPFLRARFINQMEGFIPYPNSLGLIAAEAIYKADGTWLNELKSHLRKNKNIFHDWINKNNILKVFEHEATFCSWIDARELEKENIFEYFLSNGVALKDGSEFSSSGFLRLNFGCSKDLLEEALVRMEKTLWLI